MIVYSKLLSLFYPLTSSKGNLIASLLFQVWAVNGVIKVRRAEFEAKMLLNPLRGRTS